MFTRVFWEDAFQRAVRTAFQFFLVSVGVSTTIADWNWAVIGCTVAAGFITSIANSVAAPAVPVTATGAHSAAVVSGKDGSAIGGI